ncbi:MAG: hypothetical protein LBP36_00210 [Oscillospiraceae bacterium]|jgi:dipicolinate synthase subunit A|nr:hypothetical protein [Oscillospiraceae bacterium]
MKFGIISGDRRQAILSETLVKDSHEVRVWGLDCENLEENSIEYTLEKSDIIILPLPASRDGLHINLSNISVDSKFVEMIKNKKIFCGNKNTIKTKEWQKLDVKDYAASENFKVFNAEPTAEGAIKIALNNTLKTLYKSHCLISGFGRIGKILSGMLKNLGAFVSVTNYSDGDRAWAKINNLKIVDLNNDKFLDYDFIFNTVPTQIFTEHILNKTNKECLIIDLASISGVDLNYANKLGIKVFHELGVPGKFFPVTAAEIIKESIYEIIRETCT